VKNQFQNLPFKFNLQRYISVDLGVSLYHRQQWILEEMHKCMRQA
jgi:hypothetical protein